MLRAVVTGGGTGGHVYPAIVIARSLLYRFPRSEVLFVGSKTGPELEAARTAGCRFEGLDVSGVVGKGPLHKAKASVRFLTAAIRCKRLMGEFRPACVIGTGGYAAAPACLAAVVGRIPLILHEMNFSPGLVTRVFSRRARAVTVAFEDTAGMLPEGARVVQTGVPVRPGIEALAKEANREEARRRAFERYGVSTDRRTLMVFGGSQGARALNRAVWEKLPQISGRGDLQVIHLTGKRDFSDGMCEETVEMLRYEPLSYRVFPYVEDMDLLYSTADLAFCRAGAGTLAELVAAGLPSVLVPLPHAGGHQMENAGFLESLGAARVMRQSGGSAGAALEVALDVLDDEASLGKMRLAVASIRKPDGAQGIMDIVEEVS